MSGTGCVHAGVLQNENGIITESDNKVYQHGA